MSTNEALVEPCGMYCRVSGIHVASRDGHEKPREKLAPVYGAKPEDLVRDGRRSERAWAYCQVCSIKSCCRVKIIEGCDQYSCLR